MNENIRISLSNTPQDGWHIIESNGQRIPRSGDAGGFYPLRDAIIEDRIANGRVLGDPEEDIQNYICETNPNLCFRGSGLAAPPIRTDARTFSERVGLFAKLLYSRVGRIDLVEQNEADARAKVCQGCPNNQDWHSGCAPCNSETDRKLLLIRQNRKPTLVVQGCEVTGMDLTCGTMLPKEMLTHPLKKVDSTPDFCWLRKL